MQSKVESGQLRLWRRSVFLKPDLRGKCFIVIDLDGSKTKGSPLWEILCGGRQMLRTEKMILEFSRVIND